MPLFNPTVTLNGVQTLTNKTISDPKIDSILDVNGNEILEFEPVANAVNHLALYNSATGTDIIFEVEGPDADLGINLTTHGTGKVTVNNMLVQGELNVSGNINAGDTNATFGNLNFSTVGSGADSPAADGTYGPITSISISNGIITAIS